MCDVKKMTHLIKLDDRYINIYHITYIEVISRETISISFNNGKELYFKNSKINRERLNI